MAALGAGWNVTHEGFTASVTMTPVSAVSAQDSNPQEASLD